MRQLTREDWEILACRVGGNGVLAFCTALAAVSVAGINEPNALFVSFLAAFAQGGIAAAQELKRWGEDRKGGKGSMFLLM